MPSAGLQPRELEFEQTPSPCQSLLESHVSAATRLTIALTVAIRIHVSALVGSRPLNVKERAWLPLVHATRPGAAPTRLEYFQPRQAFKVRKIAR